MNFGVIFAATCCCLIPLAAVRNVYDTFRQKPKWHEYVIYIIAPIGVAVGTYYYVFFVRELDVVALFSGGGSPSVWSDLIYHVIIPTIVLSGLFISYHMVKNVTWHFFVLTALGFIFLSWSYIIYETVKYSQDFGPSGNPEFPNVLWAIAVFISGLIIALVEMRLERMRKKE